MKFKHLWPWEVNLSRDDVSAEELFERITKEYEKIMALAGLFAGFSYVVLIGEIPDGIFEDDSVMDTETREYIYNLFSVLTFISALTATLLTSQITALLYITGNRHVFWFVKEYSHMLQLPCILIGFACGFMGIAGIIFIGGIVDASIVIIAMICFSLSYMFLSLWYYKAVSNIEIHLKNTKNIGASIGITSVSHNEHEINTTRNNNNAPNSNNGGN